MTETTAVASPGAPLPNLVIRGHSTLPIVQGGMGVGISAHRLAGTVAACGAVGTIASVDLRRHHPDLMAVNDRGNQRRNDALWLDQNGVSRVKPTNIRGTHQQNNVVALVIHHFDNALQITLHFLA